MNDKDYVVFPRGFIGVVNTSLNKESNKKTAIDKIIDLRYKNVDTNVDSDVYNSVITKLHGNMIDSLVSDKLSFNKAIIVEAFKSFDDNNFGVWINLQKNSRYFTVNHQKFILETLKYIQTGRRDTSIRTWEVILHREIIDDSEHVSKNSKFDIELKNFFAHQLSDGLILSNSLPRIFPQWLSHRGGNEDLLLTLNIIFGKELNN